jgi:large subunit ribosomal protein L6
VTATKEEITIEGIDIEEVGQTMSNLEQVTRVKKKDPRIFQDGIYLTSRE